MSLYSADGQNVSQEVDRGAMQARTILAKMSVRQRRSFIVRLFQHAGVPMDDIAETLRCAKVSARRDAREPIPDISQVLAR